ncbi:MAG: hypothetical protein KBD31_02510 [Proteobacteria bacterium]|nr:hypothetical protein [Pseudomonadota bacterium]
MNALFGSIVDYMVMFFASLFSNKVNIEDLKFYVQRFLVVITALFIGLFSYWGYVYFKNVAKEDDIVDEFVLKKDFKNTTFKNLDVYSSATNKKVIVQGPLNVYGSFQTEQSNYRDANIYGSLFATKAKFQDVNVYGAAKLSKVVARDIEVYGAFEAEDVAILNDLFIAGFGVIKDSKINYCELLGDRLTLSNTKIKKLKISNAEKKKAIVYVENGSIDAVVFDSIPGEVVVFGSAKVESIKGGTLIKSKDPITTPENKNSAHKLSE